jgi:hypothetical protein
LALKEEAKKASDLRKAKKDEVLGLGKPAETADITKAKELVASKPTPIPNKAPETAEEKAVAAEQAKLKKAADELEKTDA